MDKITGVKLYYVYDSRGSPTIEAEMKSGPISVSATSPSGASTGKAEAKVFPPGGVNDALSIFTSKIRNRITGMELNDQHQFDGLLHEIDGTDDFSVIGSAVSTALSLSYAKASAASKGIDLYEYVSHISGNAPSPPFVLGNVMNGGRHAIGGPDIQEYLSLAMGRSVRESVEANFLVHRKIAEKLKGKGMKAIGKGDEGGWVVALGNIDTLELLSEVCGAVRDENNVEVYPALDLAASQFYIERKDMYVYREQSLDSEGQLSFLAELAEKYDIRLIEDPFEENDFVHFAMLTESIGRRSVIVGDDLYVTRISRLEKGIEKGSSNGVLVKVNQVGTLIDTIDFVKLATINKYKNIISHRSGESCDNAIAHISYGLGSYAIKTGVMGGERMSKLNELIKIEENKRSK